MHESLPSSFVKFIGCTNKGSSIIVLIKTMMGLFSRHNYGGKGGGLKIWKFWESSIMYDPWTLSVNAHKQGSSINVAIQSVMGLFSRHVYGNKEWGVLKAWKFGNDVSYG